MSAPLTLTTEHAPGSPCGYILRMHEANGHSTILAACASVGVRQTLIEGLERRGIVSVFHRPGDGSILPSNTDGVAGKRRNVDLTRVADAVSGADS